MDRDSRIVGRVAEDFLFMGELSSLALASSLGVSSQALVIKNSGDNVKGTYRWGLVIDIVNEYI